jgi:import receptor subunit TOM22
MATEQPTYTPAEVEAVLEAAVAGAEAQVEELLAEEAEIESEEAEEAEIIKEEEKEQQEEAAVEEAVAAIEKEFSKEVAAAVAAAEEEEEDDDDSDSDYDDDDFDPSDETLLERIEALKDIFTPEQRNFFTSTCSNIVSGSKFATFKFGSALWYIATTSMLVGVPLAVAILNETQLTELEKELNGAGLGAPAPAPAPASTTEEKK